MAHAKVNFQATIEYLNEIKEWLFIEDQKKSFAGFYCNWDSIEYSFGRNELAIILLGEKPIGFLTWFCYEKVTKIQLVEIKPGFRKKGYGRILMEAVLEKLKQDGSMVAYLHCQPHNSEKAWERIGFKQYPTVPAFERYNKAEEGRHLYRILVPHAEQITNTKANELISLWPVERYQADRVPPKWFWALHFQKATRKLTEPIIAPVNYKWNMSWTMNDNVIKSDEIKYFAKDRIDFSGFLIIEDLPLPDLQ